jgi:hypothetical protein
VNELSYEKVPDLGGKPERSSDVFSISEVPSNRVCEVNGQKKEENAGKAKFAPVVFCGLLWRLCRNWLLDL